jgi:hypothetical protein
MTVSETDVCVCGEHVENVYTALCVGVNEYQMLREVDAWHDGAGSPSVVASEISAVTAVKYGNPPAPGITSAPEQESFGGATASARPDQLMAPNRANIASVRERKNRRCATKNLTEQDRGSQNRLLLKRTRIPRYFSARSSSKSVYCVKFPTTIERILIGRKAGVYFRARLDS